MKTTFTNSISTSEYLSTIDIYNLSLNLDNINYINNNTFIVPILYGDQTCTFHYNKYLLSGGIKTFENGPLVMPLELDYSDTKTLDKLDEIRLSLCTLLFQCRRQLGIESFIRELNQNKLPLKSLYYKKEKDARLWIYPTIENKNDIKIYGDDGNTIKMHLLFEPKNFIVKGTYRLEGLYIDKTRKKININFRITIAQVLFENIEHKKMVMKLNKNLYEQLKKNYKTDFK